ncbi:hypothetical protein ABT030_44025 [Streptomyces mirabilis]|uniref:RipA family octameric membrane protein n=1 Tax=Streptomyces mirabilis TaxID=68239 RepID=UPI00332F5A28
MYLRTTLKKYVGGSSTPLEEVRPTLWNIPAQTSGTSADDGRQQTLILEQYKLYVEMADRISGRRSLTNTFFLTLNTAIFTVIGTFWEAGRDRAAGLLFFPLVAVVVQCGAWFFLVRSYRQLNSAKYTVIGVLEERLPASPYWSAEWKALGEGKDKSKYWPLTHLEQWVPVTFACAYVGGFIAVLLG